ncbi:acyl-CoA thioesterase [Verticillium alfalfae VaMs.102]|uniref:Acyl-CoA thioesterase n=1 Tax=Verticillium alfalfae (strain VaMs.102 / ATCC MYA-4576 / FGSC 10136) TaxID=526221 RepID=C9S6Z3_VERA1|nr:acyl-CoA thioesterase [Verticillium alfalfae VaMs.102]EEY14604.1 acyl-CoA thioesterase [Verticillium alfalfae VaMs.102]
MSSSSGRTTLVKPPPYDSEKSHIENVLEVTELGVLGPDIFTNTRQPWHPPGARGIFGGAVIAQSLSAAQRTVPDPAPGEAPFFIHSCHCYFLLAGSSEIPILFHVERLCARGCRRREAGPPRRTAARRRSGTADRGKVRRRSTGMRLPASWKPGRGGHHQRLPGGDAAHLNALAYMSDSYFIGTVSRVHRLWRFPFAPSEVADLDPALRAHVERSNRVDGLGDGPDDWAARPTLGMLVSLDHSIYFHDPRRVRADEWMFSEMDTPWAGDGRGVVLQRIFAADGTLLATCVQEGLVRLTQEDVDGAARDGATAKDAGKAKL